MRRQAAWALVATCVVAWLANWLPIGPGPVAFAAPFALGLAAAWPERLHRGLLVAVAVIVATLGSAAFSGAPLDTLWLFAPPSAPAVLHGADVMVAGAVAGLGSTWLDGRPADRWRSLNAVLATSAGTGIGWWAASRLVPIDAGLAWASLGAGITALVAGQGLIAAALQWHGADRVPNPTRIKTTLAEEYRGPVLRAWQVDQALAPACPDPETRDGLGEVGAWIYRLQWTLQALDSDIEAIEIEPLTARIEALRSEAIQTSDDFTAERRSATADHLDQLLKHRDSLVLERRRTTALVDYAAAFLEEARAGLAVARHQPGEHTPERLPDVLGRLRSHAADGDARRRTARELGGIVARA